MCTQRKHTGRNCQTFRRNTSSHYAQLLNSCAPVHWGGWWPPKRHCTQKVKLCKKKKLSTIVNCDVLKLVSVTFSKMLLLFIISSLFLAHPVHYNRNQIPTEHQLGVQGQDMQYKASSIFIQTFLVFTKQVSGNCVMVVSQCLVSFISYHLFFLP